MSTPYAKSRGFPAVIGHGLFGLSLMEGLKSELKLYEETSLASLGWDEVRFKAPIVAGDTLRRPLPFRREATDQKSRTRHRDRGARPPQPARRGRDRGPPHIADPDPAGGSRRDGLAVTRQ
jgi:acyl dehydratase